jgi:hypothetical protein
MPAHAQKDYRHWGFTVVQNYQHIFLTLRTICKGLRLTYVSQTDM